MNIRTLMTTSLVTLMLVGAAQAKEGDSYYDTKAEQPTTSSEQFKAVAHSPDAKPVYNGGFRRESR